ncbi:uncharacterized protein LOC119720172 isoform X2 [Patiria miniata]|uniref:Death domain-containing protein n=1 Tax=Patiria miniata TaxID=46514 RepID=A0A913Z1G9_PATMI|nr:uncharacterized protein LOC119720172 isoform X2 [Patiria miniata]
MQQEAGVPQHTGYIGNIGNISGSNNPTVVGSSAVNINYNFPMAGPGMGAPGPQQNQLAADQQAREQALDDKTLNEVAKMLGPNWTTLAFQLDFTMVQVQTIEKNFPGDITRQGLHMLVTWRNAQSTSVEQQRTTLCNALKKDGRANVAKFLQG